jgi:hypothetical protein
MEERGGIVEQRLAFEDHRHAMWEPDIPQHRRRRHRIGRRDDRPDRHRRRPGNGRHQHVYDQGNGCRRQSHRDERKAHHRHPVALQVAKRGVVGSVEQYGGNKQRQHERWVQVQADIDGRDRHGRASEGE